MKCPICDSKNIIMWLMKKGYDSYWDIFKCKDCFTQFVYPTPSETELKELYNKYYNDDFEQALIDLRHVVAASRLRAGPIMARNPALLRRLGV